MRESRLEPDSIRDRSGRLGLLLAMSGVFCFAAFSSVSIFLYEVGWGVALLGVILSIGSGRIGYRRTPLDLPLLLFAVVEVLSIAVAPDRTQALDALKGDWILLFLPVFAQAFRGSGAVRRAYVVLLAVSSCVALYAVWQVFAGRDILRGRSLEPIGGWFIAKGLFGHHLTYGGNVLITAALALGLAAGRGMGRHRISHGMTVLVQAGGVLASFARTAWGGFLAAVVATALAARGKSRRLVLALVAGSVAAVLLLPPVRDRLWAIGGFGSDPRIRLWRTSLLIWKDHPLLGGGLGSFSTLFPLYKVPGTYMSTVHPHNDILNILVNTGILGLAAFGFLWVRFFRFAAGARRALPSDDPRRALLLGGMLAVVAVLVGGLGQCFLTDEEVGTLFWFVAAATVAVAREVRDEKG